MWDARGNSLIYLFVLCLLPVDLVLAGFSFFPQACPVYILPGINNCFGLREVNAVNFGILVHYNISFVNLNFWFTNYVN